MLLGRGFLDEIIYAIGNLINLEKHLDESYAVSGDKRFLELKNRVRKSRQKLVKVLIKEGREEEWRKYWCNLKHATSCLDQMLEIISFAKPGLHDHILEVAQEIRSEIYNTIHDLIGILNGEGEDVQVEEKQE